MAETAAPRRALGPPWTPLLALLRRELLERVRSGGHFALRSIYVFVLFCIVLLFGAEALLGSGGSITRTPETGRLLFAAFSIVQYALVMLMVPLLGAGAIVEERRDRSLGLLLLTELSYGQIVVGKVLARLGVVTLVTLSNIPVLSLASILGGVEVMDVARVFALTLSSAVMLSGITIACSAGLRSPVQAAIGSYMALIVLLLSLFGLIWVDPGFYWSWNPLVALVFGIWEPLKPGAQLWVCVGVNAAAGVASTGLAAVLLRMGVRRQRAQLRRVSVTGQVERSVAPASVWSNPIAWREWSQPGRSKVGFFVALGLGLGLAGVQSLMGFGNDAEAAPVVGAPIVLVIFSLFAIATGSSAFAQEKREQTLDLLNLTFLRSYEIIGGKALGIVRQAVYAALVVAPPLVVAGVQAEDLQGLFFLLTPVALATGILFFGAVSIFYSLVGDSPMKAAFPAVGTFIYLMMGMVFWPMILLQDEALFGLAVVIGYGVIWAPVLVLLARANSPRIGVGIGQVVAWSGVVLLASLIGDEAAAMIGLHPGALVTVSALLGSERGSQDGTMLAAVVLGIPLTLFAAWIYLWAAAQLLEERRRVEEADAESPSIAALLSGLMPGAGQLYLGAGLRGAAFISLYLGAAVILAVAAAFSHPVVGLLILIAHIAAAVDAWIQGKQRRAARQLVAQEERRNLPTPPREAA